MEKVQLNITPNQTIKVILNGQNCQLKIYYRFGKMYLDLICNNNVIQQGAVCTNRSAIIQKETNNFAGNLFFVDLLGDTDPTYQGFGNRYSLLYVGANEDIPRGFLP